MLKGTAAQVLFGDPAFRVANAFADPPFDVATRPLPDGGPSLREIAALGAEAGGRAIPSRLVGFGVERDGDRRVLHVLVDLPSTGYQDGPIRRPGARVLFEARP